jgi:hypothetical protein
MTSSADGEGLRGRSWHAALLSIVAVLLLSVFYLLPTFFAELVLWQTLPAGEGDFFRIPGYLWPSITIAILLLALLQTLLPSQFRSSPLLRSASNVATVLLLLIAVVLIVWIVTTPTL